MENGCIRALDAFILLPVLVPWQTEDVLRPRATFQISLPAPNKST